MMTKLLTIAMMTTLALGCGKKDEKAGGGDTAGKTAEKGADQAADKAADKPAGDPNVWADLEMPALGLVASAPGNAKVGAMGGIQTDDWKCRLDVFEVSDKTAPYDNLLANIEKGNKGGALKEMVKNEKTDDDNWDLRWTTESGKFGYAARRKIGDKTFDCINFQADSSEKQACAIKICESLKAK